MLPVGRVASGPAPDRDALAALPVVGAVVGGLAGGLGYAASLALPAPLPAALTIAALVGLTGAIHLDGFLDGCDAFLATVTPQRRLEILKDPRHGTYAVVGMFVAGLLWYAALAGLPPTRYPVLLAFAAALARAAALVNAFAYPYARGDVARAFVARPPIAAVVATYAVLAVVAFALWPPLVALVPTCALGALGLGRTIAARLGGGLVGDAYGFLIVVCEIGTTVALTGAGARVA
ncbi:MAG: hypothetical protein NVS3B17_03230 [Vulcanimicrobiaceae bacterium]